MSRATWLLVLLLAPTAARAPAPEWRLVPAEWSEAYLCLRPCELRHTWVARYEWRAE